MPKSRSKLRGCQYRQVEVTFRTQRARATVLMFLCTDRALQYLEVRVFIGRIGLLADFFAKANGGKDTHDPDWLGNSPVSKK